MLAHEVSHYREVPLLWATVAALIGPPLLVLAGLHRLALASIFSSWTDDSARAMRRADPARADDLLPAAGGPVSVRGPDRRVPAVRRVVTPGFLRRHRVRRWRGIISPPPACSCRHAEPHILIFASLADRRVELVAHEAIHKAVGDGPWNAAVAAVVDGIKSNRPADGFVNGIEICGQALAEHFPPDGPPRNQIPNGILET